MVEEKGYKQTTASVESRYLSVAHHRVELTWGPCGLKWLEGLVSSSTYNHATEHKHVAEYKDSAQYRAFHTRHTNCLSRGNLTSCTALPIRRLHTRRRFIILSPSMSPRCRNCDRLHHQHLLSNSSRSSPAMAMLHNLVRRTHTQRLAASSTTRRRRWASKWARQQCRRHMTTWRRM